jgi:hypothetical protein
VACCALAIRAHTEHLIPVERTAAVGTGGALNEEARRDGSRFVVHSAIKCPDAQPARSP